MTIGDLIAAARATFDRDVSSGIKSPSERFDAARPLDEHRPSSFTRLVTVGHRISSIGSGTAGCDQVLIRPVQVIEVSSAVEVVRLQIQYCGGAIDAVVGQQKACAFECVNTRGAKMYS